MSTQGEEQPDEAVAEAAAEQAPPAPTHAVDTPLHDPADQEFLGCILWATVRMFQPLGDNILRLQLLKDILDEWVRARCPSSEHSLARQMRNSEEPL